MAQHREHGALYDRNRNWNLTRASVTHTTEPERRRANQQLTSRPASVGVKEQQEAWASRPSAEDEADTGDEALSQIRVEEGPDPVLQHTVPHEIGW